MSNQIRLKRGSGSDPSASDLVTGEVAVRTDTGKLFTKKEDGSVAEISGGISDGDKGDITVSNSGATFTIDNDAVTYAKIQNVSATNRILGRDSSGAGVIEEITPANLRTMLNVADGATNVTNTNQLTNGAGFLTSVGTSNIADSAITTGKIADGAIVDADINNSANIAGSKLQAASGSNAGSMSASDKSKLDGIASGATNVTNTNQLTNGAGFITATLTNEQVQDIVGGMVSGNTESGITVTYQDGDGTLDFSVASQTDNNFTNADHSKLDGIEAGATADQTASEILTLIKTVDGSGSGLDADTLDGVSSGSFARSDANDNLSGLYTFNSTSNDIINFTGSASSDNRGISFNSRTALSADQNDGYLRLNNASEFSNGVYTPGVIRADGGFNVDNSTVIDGSGNIVASKVPTLNQNTTGTSGGFTAGNASNLNSGTVPQARLSASTLLTLIKTVDGPGSGLNADTVDGISSASFLRSDTADTASGDITFSGGAGAATIAANSDIRFTNGSWTGNSTKIQHHSNYLYIVGGSSGIIFREDGTNRWIIDGSGHLDPATDSTYDIGASGTRVRNGYFDTLYGDGSNLTGISAGATGGGSDEVFYENDQTVTSNYTITNGKNAMAAGPITINSGVTVTVGSGETLTIV